MAEAERQATTTNSIESGMLFMNVDLKNPRIDEDESLLLTETVQHIPLQPAGKQPGAPNSVPQRSGRETGAAATQPLPAQPSGPPPAAGLAGCGCGPQAGPAAAAPSSCSRACVRTFILFSIRDISARACKVKTGTSAIGRELQVCVTVCGCKCMCVCVCVRASHTHTLPQLRQMSCALLRGVH